MIPEEPSEAQIRRLVDACPQAAMFEERPYPTGLHRLRIMTFWERAFEALRSRW